MDRGPLRQHVDRPLRVTGSTAGVPDTELADYQRAVRLVLRHPLITAICPTPRRLPLVRRFSARCAGSGGRRSATGWSCTATTARLVRASDDLDASQPARSAADRPFDRRRYAYLRCAWPRSAGPACRSRCPSWPTRSPPTRSRIDGPGPGHRPGSDRAAFVDAVAWLEERGALRLADGSARRVGGRPGRAARRSTTSTATCCSPCYRPTRMVQPPRLRRGRCSSATRRSGATSGRRDAAQRGPARPGRAAGRLYDEVDDGRAQRLRAPALAADVDAADRDGRRAPRRRRAADRHRRLSAERRSRRRHRRAGRVAAARRDRRPGRRPGRPPSCPRLRRPAARRGARRAGQPRSTAGRPIAERRHRDWPTTPRRPTATRARATPIDGRRVPAASATAGCAPTVHESRRAVRERRSAPSGGPTLHRLLRGGDRPADRASVVSSRSPAGCSCCRCWPLPQRAGPAQAPRSRRCSTSGEVVVTTAATTPAPARDAGSGRPAPGSSTCGTTGTRSSSSPTAGWCCAGRTARARPRRWRCCSRSSSTAGSSRAG